MSQPPLILASSSAYRRALLTRLGLAFSVMPPGIDETVRPSESGKQAVMRLSREKAERIARSRPEATIIGSDQLALWGEQPLGKPGNHLAAMAQLQRCRGRRLAFHTGLCVLQGQERCLDVVSCGVHFRDYSDAELERYLLAERPYDCTGGFKSEGLGVSLIEKMEGPDPTALTGLPLIRLCEMLRDLGYNLP